MCGVTRRNYCVKSSSSTKKAISGGKRVFFFFVPFISSHSLPLSDKHIEYKIPIFYNSGKHDKYKITIPFSIYLSLSLFHTHTIIIIIFSLTLFLTQTENSYKPHSSIVSFYPLSLSVSHTSSLPAFICTHHVVHKQVAA